MSTYTVALHANTGFVLTPERGIVYRTPVPQLEVRKNHETHELEHPGIDRCHQWAKTNLPGRKHSLRPKHGYTWVWCLREEEWQLVEEI